MQDIVPKAPKFFIMYKRAGFRVIINHNGDMIVRPSAVEASIHVAGVAHCTLTLCCWSLLKGGQMHQMRSLQAVPSYQGCISMTIDDVIWFQSSQHRCFALRIPHSAPISPSGKDAA